MCALSKTLPVPLLFLQTLGLPSVQRMSSHYITSYRHFLFSAGFHLYRKLESAYHLALILNRILNENCFKAFFFETYDMVCGNVCSTQLPFHASQCIGLNCRTCWNNAVQFILNSDLQPLQQQQYIPHQYIKRSYKISFKQMSITIQLLIKFLSCRRLQ